MSNPLELSIDTSTRYASVAISVCGKVSVSLTWHSNRNHSVELVPAIQEVLGRVHGTIADLSAVFVAKGPGGFSALRVGISFAKSLADSRDIPLIAIPTLDVESYPFLGIGNPVCSVIKAGKTKVYAGKYDLNKGVDGHPDVEYGVFKPTDLLDSLHVRTLICGEAAGIFRNLSDPTSLRIVSSEPPTRTGSVLAKLGYNRLKSDDIDEPASLQPIYLHGAQLKSASRNV